MANTIANAHCWRAELTVGTMHGYDGPEVVKPGDLGPAIQQYQAIHGEPWYAVIVWTRGIVMGLRFQPETVIKVTLESNPLYTAEATEQNLTEYAVGLAGFLAETFHQVRIYLAVYPIRSLIVEVAPASQ